MRTPTASYKHTYIYTYHPKLLDRPLVPYSVLIVPQYSPRSQLVPTIATMTSPAGRLPFAVTVHPFPPPTHNSCAYENGPSAARNAVVFIGGLTGGPHTLDLTSLANALEQSPALDYAL